MSGSDIFVIVLCVAVVAVCAFCVIADRKGTDDKEDK